MADPFVGMGKPQSAHRPAGQGRRRFRQALEQSRAARFVTGAGFRTRSSVFTLQ